MATEENHDVVPSSALDGPEGTDEAVPETVLHSVGWDAPAAVGAEEAVIGPPLSPAKQARRIRIVNFFEELTPSEIRALRLRQLLARAAARRGRKSNDAA